ncbi:hypothetical protein APHAL10511_007138 [Amanita phalloides]|nr:hypothetical protein APHAL10511_007138 [Amanita phalloides]
MDETSSPDSDASFFASSVSSVLGVKRLRFRPHGSNQKAHVVLRRVTLSDDSGDNCDLPTVIRFSLFAQKRIEVKPGKEILLTVASEDGKFSDLPVVLEGDRNAPQISEEDNCTQIADEETQSPINSRVSQTMPPKMRRAWTKKLEVSPSIEELSPMARTSIGVQARPLYVHSSVQTQDSGDSAITATDSTCSSGIFAQTAALSPGASAAVRSPNPRRYISLKVQADSDVWLKDVASPAVHPFCAPPTDELSAINQNSKGRRSLSPMELDSAPSSRLPTSSPTVYTKEMEIGLPSETSHENHPLPPLSPSSSIASSSGAQDMQFSPVDSRSSATIAKMTESISSSVIAAGGQEDNYEAARFITPRPKNGTHGCTTPQSPSHYPCANGTPEQASIICSLEPSQKNRQKQYAALTSSPVMPVSSISTSVSSTAQSAMSTSQPSDQRLEYSPRDPIFKPSTLLPSTISSSSSLNAIASSSKVTLERVDNLHVISNSMNSGLARSGRPLEKSPEMSSDVINGKSHFVQLHPTVQGLPQPDPDAAAGQKEPSIPVKSPAPVATDSTVTSWLSPFDDRCWDADAVPGLTASHSRKARTKVQDVGDIPLPANDGQSLSTSNVVDAVHSQSPLPQFNEWTAQAPWSDSSSCATDGRATQLSVPGQTHIMTSTSSSREQYKMLPLGTSNSLPTYSAAACRPCPAEATTSSGPRGVKRERSTTPKALPLGETSDMVPKVDGHVWQGTRRHNWPVCRHDYSANLNGEGNLAVQAISFCSDGSHFALSCADRTLRIWNNIKRAEIARLSHNSPIVNVTWLEGDIGVVTLGEDGIVGKWTRVGGNFWQWAKIVDAGCEKGVENKTCLAYYRDRIAVSFPRTGVKMWIWLKGTWQAQRSIVRPNVTAIRFVDDGAALLGGTRDGVLWYCEIPNGTLRAYSFLHKTITSLDMSPTGSHVLVGQTGGRARLVSTRQSGNRGAVEVLYSLREQGQQPEDDESGYPGAIFAATGQAVLFGTVGGCVLVWDRNRATVSYGLEHDKNDVIQAVSCMDGQILTGTQQGQLLWWTQTLESAKRAKMG